MKTYLTVYPSKPDSTYQGILENGAILFTKTMYCTDPSLMYFMALMRTILMHPNISEVFLSDPIAFNYYVEARVDYNSISPQRPEIREALFQAERRLKFIRGRIGATIKLLPLIQYPELTLKTIKIEEVTYCPKINIK